MSAPVVAFPLRVVDGRRLERRFRDVLLPGGILCDHGGQARVLPRFFYEVTSWEEARDTYLTPHFSVSEFIHTDVREAPPLRVFPRYIPCATALLALALEQLREAVGTYVYIGANGGYCRGTHGLAARRPIAGARRRTSIGLATRISTTTTRSSDTPTSCERCCRPPGRARSARRTRIPTTISTWISAMSRPYHARRRARRST
jgi:hypothetical protein